MNQEDARNTTQPLRYGHQAHDDRVLWLIRGAVLSKMVSEDSSVLCGSLISICLMKGGTDRFCSKLSFQGCLYCEHPWRIEIGHPTGAEGRFVLMSDIIVVLFPSGAGWVAAYKNGIS